MPTIAEGGPEYNKLMFNYTRSWTDDLPFCKVSGMYKINVILFLAILLVIIIIFFIKYFIGVGYLTRQRYDESGQRREELESEDISLRCCYDDTGIVWLYGLFNGHNGADTARFARDRIAAEILLGQLPTTEMDQIAKEIIQ